MPLKRNFWRSFEKTPRQRFNCADCDKTFFSQIKLLKHVKSLHSKGDGLSSMEGDEDFSVESEKNIKALPEYPNENIITKNNETQENDKKCESWIFFMKCVY